MGEAPALPFAVEDLQRQLPPDANKLLLVILSCNSRRLPSVARHAVEAHFSRMLGFRLPIDSFHLSSLPFISSLMFWSMTLTPFACFLLVTLCSGWIDLGRSSTLAASSKVSASTLRRYEPFSILFCLNCREMYRYLLDPASVLFIVSLGRQRKSCLARTNLLSRFYSFLLASPSLIYGYPD